MDRVGLKVESKFQAWCKSKVVASSLFDTERGMNSPTSRAVLIEIAMPGGAHFSS